jgi:hypothetical protein
MYGNGSILTKGFRISINRAFLLFKVKKRFMFGDECLYVAGIEENSWCKDLGLEERLQASGFRRQASGVRRE